LGVGFGVSGRTKDDELGDDIVHSHRTEARVFDSGHVVGFSGEKVRFFTELWV
jgi:hypothetical protein